MTELRADEASGELDDELVDELEDVELAPEVDEMADEVLEVGETLHGGCGVDVVVEVVVVVAMVVGVGVALADDWLLIGPATPRWCRWPTSLLAGCFNDADASVSFGALCELACCWWCRLLLLAACNSRQLEASIGVLALFACCFACACWAPLKGDEGESASTGWRWGK